MAQNKLLTAVSLGLCLACSSPGATQQRSAAPSPAATAPAPSAPAAKPAPVAATDFRRQFVEVAKTVRPTVVAITSVSTVEVGTSRFEGSPFEFFFHGAPHPEKQKRQGVGTGVIVDPRGYILTNNHVVADADEIKVALKDDRELEAQVVGTDPKTDVAIIKVKLDGLKGEPLQAAALGDSDKLEVGEWVMAVGSPFGLTQTVSAGIVSAVGRGHVGIADYEDFIQTDAAINPGNSGGPLVNMNGQVVGINTAIASRTGGNNGVGFAIPINMARSVMHQLIDHGQVVRGYLGVYIGDVNEELAKSFGYQGKGGVLVQDVSADGPGAKAGLKAGDIILERDGKPASDVTSFRNGIAQSAPGTSLALVVFRDGKRMSLSAKLEALPGEATGKPGKHAPKAGGRGLGVSDITPELKQRLQLELDRGAVVVQVRPDSSADQAGLKPGDVIAQVGADEVKNAKDAERMIGHSDAGKALRLRVIREGHGVFVILPPVRP
ncbi:MAG: trypsin-like peptidase domain-containing protein [Polyangiales bacterium]